MPVLAAKRSRKSAAGMVERRELKWLRMFLVCVACTDFREQIDALYDPEIIVQTFTNILTKDIMIMLIMILMHPDENDRNLDKHS